MTTALRIVIVDDHALFRAGLQQTIAAEADLVFSGECAAAHEVLAHIATQPCDVLLLDLSLPDMSGLDLLPQLQRYHPDVAVLMLSGYPETQFGLHALRAGARGFISKTAEPAELLRAIRAVARGNRYISQGLTDVLVNGLGAPTSGPLHQCLSQREFQILCKLAEGAGVTAIGAELNLSAKTISTYRSRVLTKLGLNSNADLVTYAIRNQLLR